MDQKRLVYVVDDDVSVREGVANLVASAGLAARTAGSGKEFLSMERPDIPSCLVLDVNLPDLSGLELQQEFLRCRIQIPIIFLTGHGDIPMTVRALKAGAADFLTKPVDDKVLLNAIRQSIGRYQASDGLTEIGNQSLEQTLHQEQKIRRWPSFDEIIGKSAALEQVLQMVETVAPNDSTVFLLGETGTGKELIAHAVHSLSCRRSGAFVKLNCAAIPTGLLESELFGHEKGAFTGAIAQRIGRFEAANHGTIFLDEIGEVSLELQPKLLRVLQEREFERLGSTRTLRTDARLIAATNRDLASMVQQGKFRCDLFYRLNVFPIQIPALRERPEDIPLLVRHFTRHFAHCMKKKIESIPSETMELLRQYQWPGNIRELQNVIERAVILSSGPTLQVPPANFTLMRSAAPIDHGEAPGNLRRTLAQAEREQILAALEAAWWVIAGPNGAEARLGMARSSLQNRMQRLGIARQRMPYRPREMPLPAITFPGTSDIA